MAVSIMLSYLKRKCLYYLLLTLLAIIETFLSFFFASSGNCDCVNWEKRLPGNDDSMEYSKSGFLNVAASRNTLFQMLIMFI